ncbi:MAG TPA: glycosyltransferase family 4 protein [Pyrinomonadaceae bacterium]|nr:glycosyltransferase family 4 protein [Pyrinomonadaceae bacterium]
MRVAYLTEIPTPYREPLLDLLANQDGLELEVLYCSTTARGRDWKWDHKAHECLPGINAATGQGNLFLNPTIGRRLSRGQYDVVVISGYAHPTMVMAMLWCALHKVPYILLSESQHLTRRSQLRRFVKRPLIQFAIKRASAFLVMGADGRDYLMSYGASRERIFFFPNTPDVERIAEEVRVCRLNKAELKNELGLLGKFLILFVGRLAEEKNVEILLSAFRLLQRDFPDSGLAIIGDGPRRELLMRLAGELSLSNVTFVGFVDPEDLPKYYALADVFALPSIYEPWGVVVLEAMASALPIVISDKVGCVRDLVQARENGFVLPPSDKGRWADALISLKRQTALREEMGRNSRKVISEFDYVFCISQFRQALASVTQANHSIDAGQNQLTKLR